MQNTLALIRQYEVGRAHEGQGVPTPYDVVNWTAFRHHRPRLRLTLMTVGEVIDWQSATIEAQRVAGLASSRRSSAAGAYQIIRSTLIGLLERGVVLRTDLFDMQTQEKLGAALLRRRGWFEWRAGKLTDADMVNAIAQEWASLPTMTGRGAYDGVGTNKALTGPGAVLAALYADRDGDKPAEPDMTDDLLKRHRTQAPQPERPGRVAPSEATFWQTLWSVLNKLWSRGA